MSTHESAAGEAPRLWGGTTLADRRAVRRDKLLAAGLDLLGADQPAALSVRAVCRGAELTERYFYESFTDRDELVGAVYDAVAEEARRTLEQATSELTGPADIARAAVESMVRLMLDDPRKGRVLLVAPLTEHQLTGRGARALPAVLSMIRAQLSPEAPEADRDLIATGFVGALMSLFHAFLSGQLAVSREQFVEHCVRLLLSARRLESPRPS